MMDLMRERIASGARKRRQKCAEFLRELVRTPSGSRGEADVARLVRTEMRKLGYPKVDVDRFGNVIGVVGDGRAQLYYDAHLDTPTLGDSSLWRYDPYEGEVRAGKIYGHGVAQNKAGLAALVYAGALIHELDLSADATVHVVGSVQAKECDGLAYRALLDVENKRPHFVVLSAPTDMRIHRGHRGRAELELELEGSTGCIARIAQVINAVSELNTRLPEDAFLGRASVEVTHIETAYNGADVPPESARLLINRRLVSGERRSSAIKELREALRAAEAKVELVGYDAPSYTGLRLPTEKYFPTWVLPEEHPLVRSASAAYRNVFDRAPEVSRWDGSTAGTYTMGVANVPTIGFGPSDERLAGPVNEHVKIEDLEKSIAFYATLPAYLPDA